jgi:hypothetical protein
MEKDTSTNRGRKLDWRDALRPTLLTGFGLGLLGAAALPLLLSGLLNLQLATHDRSVRVLPIVGFVVLFTVISFLELAHRAQGRETTTSYAAPPAVVVICALILGIILQNDTERKVEAENRLARETRDFKMKMKDPKFVMNLRPPLSLAERMLVRSEIGSANPRDSDLTTREIHALLTNFGPDFEDVIGENPKTSPEDLAWIAKHGGIPGRGAVAVNWATPEHILRELLKDENPWVESWAERNAVRRLCDPQLLQSAWEHARKSELKPDNDIYSLLARNSCTPLPTLETLSGYPSVVGEAARETLAHRTAGRKQSAKN